MAKTVFIMKGVFPGEYKSNIHVWDGDKGTVEFKESYWNERSSLGRIWIDGIEIFAKRASQLRRGFSGKKLNFTWGYESHSTRITALAICLHIFDNEQTAINMYLPFMKVVMKDIERKSFEMNLDITDFYLDNFCRTSPDFHTLYCDLGLQGNHEISFTKDQQLGDFYCDIRDQICRDLVEKEKKEYYKPSLTTILGIPDPPKPEFEWDAAFKRNKKELTDLYFTSGQLRTKTKSTMVSKIKFDTKWYGVSRKEDYYEKNKDKIEDIRRRVAEFRQRKDN